MAGRHFAALAVSLWTKCNYICCENKCSRVCIGAIIMHLLGEVKCLCSVDWTNIHSSMVSSAEAEWLRKRQATWRLPPGKGWQGMTQAWNVVQRHVQKLVQRNPVTVLRVLGLPVMCSLWYYLLCKLPFALRFAGHITRIVAHNKWYHQNKTIQIYIIYNIKYIKYTNRLWSSIFRHAKWPQFSGTQIGHSTEFIQPWR